MENKIKKVNDKHLAKEKEWEAQENKLQDNVASLEKKLKKHEDFYATEVAELKEALDAKVKYINDPW